MMVTIRAHQAESPNRLWVMYAAVWAYSLLALRYVHKFANQICIPVDHSWANRAINHTVMLSDVPARGQGYRTSAFELNR